MSTKHLITLISITVIVSIASIAIAKNVLRYNDTLLEQNLDALMDGESLFIKCSIYCKPSPGYVCILYTNYDYNINCEEMEPWQL